jgi:hypothetical protein
MEIMQNKLDIEWSEDWALYVKYYSRDRDAGTYLLNAPQRKGATLFIGLMT